MAAKALKIPPAQLYDEDFAVWTEEVGRLLREKRFEEVDVEHVAEEIEDMGKSQRNEVLSRLTLIITHLLKWKFQPEKRSGSWRATLNVQRRDLRRSLQISPSLRRKGQDSLEELYADAMDDAAAETGLPVATFPADCPFTVDQILNGEFLPE